ncbi:sigma 54-interacting transcriptional regulator [Ammoniphilus resinae]|uniref:PAS domain S-box-containing protein n=1 Tax=Ammoniphilus resinae TaxID=861532 RepID=A0ABS4GR12_9BACL|nr:sigma 54-interacting transcriptional regulator [Ammoniphilus resinae]MBP1932715.1 PAS domain S-box-containing protein [Ammoniphilus resinae]
MDPIQLIAPFEDQAKVAEQACEKLGVKIPIHVGSMDEAVKHAKRAEASGVEVLISRGTSAWKIAQSGVNIPLVEIPITGYDLLRAFMEARQLGQKIGIADIPDVLHGVEALEEIFHYPIEKHVIESLEDVDLAVHRLMERDIEVLIGKWVYVQKLKETPIKTVVLSSGIESIIQAIKEAKNLLEVRRKEAARSKQIRAILDFIADGVISVDEQGKVSVCNPAAEKILNIQSTDIVGRKIDDILPQSRINQVLLSGREELNSIQEYNGTKMIANRIPILYGEKVMGVVNTFQELKKLQQQEQEIRKKLSHQGHVTKYQLDKIVGTSPSFLGAMEKVSNYAKADSTILLSGETGVGKEVFAHMIHNLSHRSKGPFVAVNCAAIPENLLESELFGYVEGAFTGAKKGGKTGLFELAHGGTIFLDEIGELAASLQARLLRVLQEEEVMRLGDERVIPIDIRVVTASNRDLEEMVEAGGFRADLFYRINILHIHVPALRERKEDIPLLCDLFLEELEDQIHKKICGFKQEAMQIMQEYHWPGNIRQLRNVVERAAILSADEWIDQETVIEAGGRAFQSIGLTYRPQINETSKLEDYEIKHILQVLEQVGGNQTEAAKILGIGRTTLWRKLNRR